MSVTHPLVTCLTVFAIIWSSSNIDLTSAFSFRSAGETINQDFQGALHAACRRFHTIFNWTLSLMPKVKLEDVNPSPVSLPHLPKNNASSSNATTTPSNKNITIPEKPDKLNEIRFQRYLDNSYSPNSTSSSTSSSTPLPTDATQAPEELKSSSEAPDNSTESTSESSSDTNTNTQDKNTNTATTKAPKKSSSSAHSLFKTNFGWTHVTALIAPFLFAMMAS